MADFEAHWRDTMRPPRFFQFDARAAGPILFFIMHIRLWTLLTALVCMFIFYVLERKGLTFSSAFRALRAWVVGDYRPAYLFYKKRKMIDNG